MVGNSATLWDSWFCGADVEAAIELRGIARDYFAAEPPGQPNAQRRFTRSRGTYDGNEWPIRFVWSHRKRRWRARTKIKISTNSARRRLPRICWRASFT